MTNPLTLYVPIKQDEVSQAAALFIHANFVASVKAGLDASEIVHYARISLIHNASGEGINAIILMTEFDGPMQPYLKFFWNNDGTKRAFKAIAEIALTPPNPLVIDLTGFENFIDDNNLNEEGDMYAAYPQTVKDIEKAFSTTAKAHTH
jgi:hypothetical protein